MKVSTKGIYALEIITDLALHTDEEKLESIGNIARRRHLSEKYSERLIKGLKDAGLVISIRGAYGGYRLLRDADQITVGDVLRAVEGELAPVECLTQNAECKMDCGICPTRRTWEQMWQIIEDTVAEITIGDIVKKVKNVLTDPENPCIN